MIRLVVSNSALRLGMEEDPWIRDHSPVSPAILHALGYLNWRWNIAEIGLQAMFSTVTGSYSQKAGR